MKPIYVLNSLAAVFTVVTLLNGSAAMAQPNPFEQYANSPSVEDPNVEKLRKQKNTKSMTRNTNFGKAMSFIYRRFNQVELSGLLQQMKHDGLTKKSFTAVIGVKGSAFYVSELKKSSQNITRDTGVEIIPFEIRYDPTRSKVYLDVSAIGFRNMNTHAKENGSIMGDWSISGDGIGTVVNRLDLVTFIYDDGFSNERLSGVEAKLINVELGNRIRFKKDNSLGMYAGFSAGVNFHQTYIDDEGNEIDFGKNTNISVVGSEELPGTFDGLYKSSLTFRGKAKLDYLKEWKSSSFKIGAEVEVGNTRGNSLPAETLRSYTENYNQNLQQYNDDKTLYQSWVDQKTQWEADNNYTESLEIEEYLNLSGAEAPPTDPGKFSQSEHKFYDKTKVKWLMVRPSVEYTKQVKKGDKPLSVGVGLYGNIPIQNKIVVSENEGNKTMDIRSSQRDMLKMSFFLKF